MTETMTQLFTRHEAVERAPGFKIADRVRLHFLFKRLGDPDWRAADYVVDATIVGGPQTSELPDAPFEPYLLPAEPLPKGEPYASGHPFRMNEGTLPHKLLDGSHLLVRYVVLGHEEALSFRDLQ